LKETILLFQITDETTKKALRRALLPLRIRLKKIEPDDYGRTLGELAESASDTAQATAADPCTDRNIPDLSSGTAEPLPAPMLIFAGLSGQRLDLVLKRLRDNGVRLPYKAVLTETNRSWTPARCFQEIKREHEAMSRSRS
jgi:hypothetical protein